MLTPWPPDCLPKIAPSSTSMMAGMARMNTTDWRSRKNAFSSTEPRDNPVRHTPGNGDCAARTTTDPLVFEMAVIACLLSAPDRRPREWAW